MPDTSHLRIEGFVGAHSPWRHSSCGGEGVGAGVHSQEAASHTMVFPASGWLFLHRHAERSVSMVILDPVRLAIISYQHRFDTLKCAQMVVK